MSAGDRDLVLERLQNFLFHVDDLQVKGRTKGINA
jgi:hypothetical protein